MSRRTKVASSPLGKDPLREFARWFRKASGHSRIKLPEAMCLSTVGRDGAPHGRMLLLKGFGEKGFVFYTNLNSPKACDLKENPTVAMTFYWEPLRRQVRIEGRVEPVSDAEADVYFASRPRLSQIGAWISNQSEPLSSRLILIRRFLSRLKEFGTGLVPRPPYWSGYRLIPDKIEFWEEKPNRLHDRFLYVRKGNGWEMSRLYP